MISHTWIKHKYFMLLQVGIVAAYGQEIEPGKEKGQRRASET